MKKFKRANIMGWCQLAESNEQQAKKLKWQIGI